MRSLGRRRTSSARRNSILILSRPKIPPAFTRRKRPREFLASRLISRGKVRTRCALATLHRHHNRLNHRFLNGSVESTNSQARPAKHDREIDGKSFVEPVRGGPRHY